MATKMKICTKCGKRKPLSGFHKDASKKDGIRNYCKECANEMNRKSAASRKSKMRPDEAKRKGERQLGFEEEAKTIIMISRLVESVVPAIVDNFGMKAEVMVKLKPKESK